MKLTQAIYDLATYNEYIPIIREEIERVSAEDGEIKYTSLAKMKKMDSFIKESQRLNAPTLLTLQRYTTAPVTLPDGKCLPVGTSLAVAAREVNFDERIHRNPKVFDGLRFEKLRQQAGNENKYQIVTTGYAIYLVTCCLITLNLTFMI